MDGVEIEEGYCKDYFITLNTLSKNNIDNLLPVSFSEKTCFTRKENSLNGKELEDLLKVTQEKLNNEFIKWISNLKDGVNLFEDFAKQFYKKC